jgi:hypothetical protein
MTPATANKALRPKSPRKMAILTGLQDCSKAKGIRKARISAAKPVPATATKPALVGLPAVTLPPDMSNFLITDSEPSPVINQYPAYFNQTGTLAGMTRLPYLGSGIPSGTQACFADLIIVRITLQNYLSRTVTDPAFLLDRNRTGISTGDSSLAEFTGNTK